MNPRIKKLGYIVGSAFIVLAVFSVGVYVGFSRSPEVDRIVSVTNKVPPSAIAATADFDPFWKVWNILNEKSIFANDVSDQDRVWGAAAGLAASLGDPYTTFMPPEENKLFNDTIQGSFGGIGAEIGIKEKVLTVVAPIKDSPAWNAGLKSGDKILKIGELETTDVTMDKALSLIRGDEGTSVTLTILRPGENRTREFTIVRAIIDLPTIDTELRPDNVFVITFYGFSENSVELFRDALQKFIASGTNKLVIDLRGNPGGYLDAAVNISSWFIDTGKPIVIEDFGDKKKAETYRSRGPRIFNENLKLVLLVDGGSASASEIMAGALKEHDIGTVVGERTFGKSSVQELIPITDETSLKITVARWLTPNGVSLSTGGLEPDIVVPITEEDIKAGRDPQMSKAVEILLRN